MGNQLVDKSLYLTGQEHIFAGSTPDIIPAESSPDWFRPQGLLKGRFTLDEIETARAAKGFINSPLIGLAMGVRRDPGEIVGYALSALDRGTGTTLEDPKLIVGRWQPEGRHLVGRNITEDFIAFNNSFPQETRIYLPLRSGGQTAEGVRVHPEKR